MSDNSTALLEAVKEFLNSADFDTAWYFLKELFSSNLKFIVFVGCFAFAMFLVFLWFNFFIDYSYKLFDWLGTYFSRKRFKERFVQDEPYEIVPICHGFDREVYIVTNWTPHNQHPNEFRCYNEDNARLMCTIMNCDNDYKKFSVKAYMKGFDIKKLKAHKEG